MSAPPFTLTAPEVEALTFQWVPTDLLDEITPPQKSSPNDWIVKNAQGEPTLATFDWDENMLIPGEVLADGQIVDFSGVHTFGWSEIITEEDGSVSASPEIDPRATQLDAGVACFFDSIEDAAREGITDLRASCWTRREFRFDAATGTFLPATEGEPA